MRDRGLRFGIGTSPIGGFYPNRGVGYSHNRVSASGSGSSRDEQRGGPSREVLRRIVRRQSVDQSDVLKAYQVVSRYRDMHAYPLKKVTWGVSYHIKMIRAGNDSIRAGQRFKRMDRILNKLGRLPTRLSQMEDIGGCRAILTNLDQVYAVGERLNQRWRHATVIDYIQNPKESGYRAYHLIERRDGRLIEVQLRTPQQDQWAVAVETWVPPVVPFNLKNEEGPEDVKRFFKKTSEIMALEEIGEVPDDEDRRELADLRATITAQYLVR